MTRQATHEGLARESFFQNVVEKQEGTLVVASEDVLCDAKICVVVQHVERLGHLLECEVATAERHRLVEHRQRVPHTTVGLAGNQVERLVVELHTLLTGDMFEVAHGVLNTYTVEVVDLATGKDGCGDFVLLGGCKDEDGVVWGLFEGFEEGVECRLGEHVHLIDDVDAVLSHLGRNAHLVRKVADVLHGVVGCGVELVNREAPTLVETPARLALATSVALGCGGQAVDGLCEDTRAGGLTHTSGSTKEECVSQLPTGNGVFEGVCNVALSHNRFEGHRTIFACRNNKITAIHFFCFPCEV